MVCTRDNFTISKTQNVYSSFGAVFCTMLCLFTNRVEADTLSIRTPPTKKLNVRDVVKKDGIILPVLMNYKHFHVTYFLYKFITPVNVVDNRRLISGNFSLK